MLLVDDTVSPLVLYSNGDKSMYVLVLDFSRYLRIVAVYRSALCEETWSIKSSLKLFLVACGVKNGTAPE
jgi:hypothetical protein